MPRYQNPYPQIIDGNGDPVVGGQLFFYESGTNTLKTIYADSTELTPIANPVTLAADGGIPNIFYSGSARVVCKKPDGMQVFARDPVGGESVLGNFSAYDAVITYDANDIVKASNEKFYLSLQDGNQGNEPSANPAFWEEIRFIGVYNATVSYATGDVVQTSDGFLWRSVQTANLNNNPSTDDGSNWKPVTAEQWQTVTSSITIINGVKYTVDASAGAIDCTVPAFSANDRFTVHNNADNTNTVRVAVAAGVTIRGGAGSITNPDALVLEAGDTVELLALSASLLEVI